MSKNVAIKEGSTSKQFGGTKKLRTNLVGGSTADWVPEDEVQLTSLHITEDGEYNANDEGYYGYNPVTVSGIGKATFTAEDGDVLFGEELEGNEPYELDPNDPDEPLKMLPSAIGFALLPAKLVYEDGEHITLTGAVVRAYKNSGGDWESEDYPNGIIPLEELTVSPSEADIDSIISEYTITNPTIGGEPTNAVIRMKSLSVGRIASEDDRYDIHNNPSSVTYNFYATFVNNTLILVAPDGSRTNADIWVRVSNIGYQAAWDSVTIDGQTVWYIPYDNYSRVSFLQEEYGYPTSDADILSIKQIAWLMVNSSDGSRIGKQEITVKWGGIDKELTTTYPIQINT